MYTHWNVAVTLALNPSPEGYFDFAHGLADLSGAAILPYFRHALVVKNKASGAGFDPVTAADRAAERAIRAAIAKPASRITASSARSSPPCAGAGRYQWVVDPIDGTRAFIMGSPLWGTLIGLVDDGRPVLGLMDQPFTRERFWAYRRRCAHARARRQDAQAEDARLQQAWRKPC